MRVFTRIFGIPSITANNLKTLLTTGLLSICLLGPATLRAQQPADIRFKTLNVKDGLSSSTVNDILKDDFGYMWFATDDGLNKFDGRNFSIYRNDPRDSTTISSNQVVDLALDDSGEVWAMTSTGFASRYDRKKDKFVNIRLNGWLGRSVASDGNGTLWIGCYGGLLFYDTKTGRVTRAGERWKAAETFRDKTVIAMLRDKNNRMWLGTDKGLFTIDPKTGDMQVTTKEPGNPGALPDEHIRCLAQSPDGRIWVGTDVGICAINLQTHAVSSFTTAGVEGKTLSSNMVYTIDIESDRSLWIGTEEGLNLLDLHTERITRVGNAGPYHLNGKSVRSILIDRHGLFWIGTYQGGVNKYDKNLALFNLRQSNSNDPKGLSAPTVTSFVEDGGFVYVGTDGGGLNRYDRRTETFTKLPIYKRPGGKGLAIMSMKKIGGKIWIGTFLDGLFVYDPHTGKTEHFERGDSPNTLNANDIFCFEEDKDGRVWIGTNGGGVNIYDPAKRTFELFFPRMKAKAGDRFTLNNYIRDIRRDREGRMWIASFGTGIACYDPAVDDVRMFNTWNSGLGLNNVLSIAFDQKNRTWVGTSGGGLCLLDPKTQRFTRFNEVDGLANSTVHKVLVADDGNIWLSTNKGISVFHPENRRFRNYSYNNGLQRNTFVLGSGLKLAGGELFFGGVDGFNFFDPRKLNVNKNRPTMVLTELKVDNKPVVPGTDAPINEHISEAREIHLDYKQNFAISFNTLNFTSPEESLYAYKLDGFDKSWNEIGKATTAAYTNLDPGEYTFHVRAKSDAGWWSTPETSLKIFVRPPLWMTWYAYIIYAFLVGGALLGIRHRGITKLKREFALEQERVAARQLLEQQKREAERIHELDQVKLKFLTNLSHDFRTPISLIMGPVEKLISQEGNREKSGQLSLIRRNSKRLLNLVNQLLDYRKLEERELTLNTSTGDIVAFVKDVAESFRDVAERKKIAFSVESEVDQYVTQFDRDKIERMLFNLLSNAFKFTFESGTITVKARKTLHPSTGIEFAVSDNGIGINDDVRKKLFERFFQSTPSVSLPLQGSGIGLAITREFARMHGGEIAVDSELNTGSTFTVFLPLEQLSAVIPEEQGMHEPETRALDIAEMPLTEARTDLMTVLLVEDNDDFRFYLKDNLKGYYRVIEAGNGQEGWQKALALHPNVVVSDVNMPQMNGFQLCKKIKTDKRTAQIPVILLTALNDQDTQVTGLGTGASDYITKPFNFEILRVKIDNLLKQTQTFRDAYSRQIKIESSEVKFEAEGDKLMRKVMAYIESKLIDPQLSVEDLSRHVGMSRGSLYRKIVELTGQTPVEFIRSVKLEKGAALLEKSDLRISQIAYEVGFSTPNYFAKAFKAKYHLLPSEYVVVKRGTATQGAFEEEA